MSLNLRKTFIEVSDSNSIVVRSWQHVVVVVIELVLLSLWI